MTQLLTHVIFTDFQENFSVKTRHHYSSILQQNYTKIALQSLAELNNFSFQILKHYSLLKIHFYTRIESLDVQCSFKSHYFRFKSHKTKKQLSHWPQWEEVSRCNTATAKRSFRLSQKWPNICLTLCQKLAFSAGRECVET